MTDPNVRDGSNGFMIQNWHIPLLGMLPGDGAATVLAAMCDAVAGDYSLFEALDDHEKSVFLALWHTYKDMLGR